MDPRNNTVSDWLSVTDGGVALKLISHLPFAPLPPWCKFICLILWKCSDGRRPKYGSKICGKALLGTLGSLIQGSATYWCSVSTDKSSAWTFQHNLKWCHKLKMKIHYLSVLFLLPEIPSHLKEIAKHCQTPFGFVRTRNLLLQIAALCLFAFP